MPQSSSIPTISTGKMSIRKMRLYVCVPVRLYLPKNKTQRKELRSIETLLTHLDMSARSPSHSRASSFRGAVLASPGRRVSSLVVDAHRSLPVASTFVPAPRRPVRDVARTVRRLFEEHKGELKRVDTKKELTLDDVRSIFPNEDGKTRRTVLACMTHLADFDLRGRWHDFGDLSNVTRGTKGR